MARITMQPRRFLLFLLFSPHVWDDLFLQLQLLFLPFPPIPSSPPLSTMAPRYKGGKEVAHPDDNSGGSIWKKEKGREGMFSPLLLVPSRESDFGLFNGNQCIGKVAKSPRDKITQKTKSPTSMKKDKNTHLKITQGKNHPKDKITQGTKSLKRQYLPFSFMKTKSPTLKSPKKLR